MSTEHTPPTPKVAPGQVWVPNANAPGGGGVLRIVCRYPFATHEGQTLWIVEYLTYASKIERMDEVALVNWWHLAEEE